MNKQFQKIKIFTIFFALFCSSIFVICPIGKSGPIDQFYECTPLLMIEYNESLNEAPLIPFGEPRIIPVKLKAKIIGPADDIVLEFLKKAKVKLFVYLSIAEVSEGIHASITPTIVEFPVSGEYESTNASISVTINQYLPVTSQKSIVVVMGSKKLGSDATLVKASNITQEIPFVVGYYPQLSFTYVDGNTRNINPDETAGFTYEIQNWGNGVTNVFSEIEDLPDGWIAEIVHVTTLGSELVGGTSKKTISLKVKPPIDFGYHEDRAIIKVSMTPVSKVNSEDTGEPHYLYFIVQSKGFSTPGFETIILLFAIIIVFLPIIIRKNRKNETKKQGGKRGCQ